MPILNFQKADSIENVINYLWPVFLYPNDPSRCFEYYVRAAVASHIQSDHSLELTLPRDWVLALLYGKSLEETEKEVSKRSRKGVTAGAVFLIANLCDQLGQPIHFNTAEAVIVTAEENKRLGKAFGETAHANKAQINSAWNEYRSVAHLWAAASVIDIAVASGGLRPSPSLFAEVLGLAATFGDWAVSKRMGRGKQSAPVIDPGSIWQIPDFVGRIPVPQIEQEKLESWLVTCIKKRKPVETL